MITEQSQQFFKNEVENTDGTVFVCEEKEFSHIKTIIQNGEND